MWHVSYRIVRVGLLLLALISLACSGDVTTATDDRSARTQPFDDPDLARHQVLATLVAGAMQSRPIRHSFWGATNASAVKEGKIHFQTYLATSGAPLRRAMLRVGQLSEADLEALLNEVGSLEMYLPVDGHRQSWPGDEDVIVATQLDEQNEVPFGVNLRGEEVPLSISAPPDVPAIVLVPAESFNPHGVPYATHQRPKSGRDSSSTRDHCGPYVFEDCHDDTGSANHWPGLWVVASHVDDLGEGWPRGDPEIEIDLLGPEIVGGIADMENFKLYDCAHEDVSGDRHFDQDTHDWSGEALVADSARLEAFRSAYPDTLSDEEQMFTIQVWEDDTYRCETVTDISNVRTLLESLILTWGGLALIQEGGAFGLWSGTAMIWEGIFRATVAFGGEDDLIGQVHAASAWNEEHPDQAVSHSHVLVDENGELNGWLDIVWMDRRY